MPIYAYRCASCGHTKDVLQKMSDPPLTTCPVCAQEAFEKQLTAAGFQLKGSGWYVTDFRDKAAASASAESSPAAAPAAASTSSSAADGASNATTTATLASAPATSTPAASPSTAAKTTPPSTVSTPSAS